MEGRPRSLKLTWSLRLSAPLLIALTLPAFSTRTIFAAELQNSAQAREIQGNLALKGKHLHADINAKYKELMSTKSYARENDVTSIVQKYVSPTMSIEDIKLVLRSAGLGDPGLTVDGHLFFCGNIGGFWFLTVSRFAVDISPQSPGDFHAIKDISGSLFSVDL